MNSVGVPGSTACNCTGQGFVWDAGKGLCVCPTNSYYNPVTASCGEFDRRIGNAPASGRCNGTNLASAMVAQLCVAAINTAMALHAVSGKHDEVTASIGISAEG
jgi:hypothetical protein